MTRTHPVDASAWLEYLRKTESETDLFICSLIHPGADLATNP